MTLVINKHIKLCVVTRVSLRECRYAECRYAECRGTILTLSLHKVDFIVKKFNENAHPFPGLQFFPFLKAIKNLVVSLPMWACLFLSHKSEAEAAVHFLCHLNFLAKLILIFLFFINWYKSATICSYWVAPLVLDMFWIFFVKNHKIFNNSTAT